MSYSGLIIRIGLAVLITFLTATGVVALIVLFLLNLSLDEVLLLWAVFVLCAGPFFGAALVLGE